MIDVKSHPLLEQCHDVCVAVQKISSPELGPSATKKAARLLNDLNDYIQTINEINAEYDRQCVYRIYQDKDKWVAIDQTFVNYQISDYGKGDSPSQALSELLYGS